MVSKERARRDSALRVATTYAQSGDVDGVLTWLHVAGQHMVVGETSHRRLWHMLANANNAGRNARIEAMFHEHQSRIRARGECDNG